MCSFNLTCPDRFAVPQASRELRRTLPRDFFEYMGIMHAKDEQPGDEEEEDEGEQCAQSTSCLRFFVFKWNGSTTPYFVSSAVAEKYSGRGCGYGGCRLDSWCW